MLAWNDNYSVNVLELDKHHQRIMQMINSLNEAIIHNHSDDIIEQVLDNLVDYAVYHFGAEEDYFEKFNYPKTDEHVAEHESFIKKISGLKIDYLNHKKIDAIELLNFLQNWFLHHIQELDHEYSKFLNKNGLF